MFYFKAQMQFGHENETNFSGDIYRLEDAENYSEGTCFIPADQLADPEEAVFNAIWYAKNVITDTNCDFSQVMQSLKEKILTDIDEWKALGETRFIVLSQPDVTKLQKIIVPGSNEKNTDLTNRGYLLGKLGKHVD